MLLDKAESPWSGHRAPTPGKIARFNRNDECDDSGRGVLVAPGLDDGEHAAGCHELDRVGTMADLAAHRAATFVYAVANSRG